MNKHKFWMLALLFAVLISGCSTTDEKDTASKDTTTQTYPMSISHALGETVIDKEPKRIATISWGNQDVPLALGVVPVGASKANYGVNDASGLLPWTLAKYRELGIDQPILFDDTDGLDYEAISNTSPDVILAGYSGLTQEEYDLLSQIAPVIPYQQQPWLTLWREQIILDATGMGRKQEGEALVKELEKLVQEKIDTVPQLKGKSAAFCYFNPADLGQFYVYLPSDPRAAYLTDLGLHFPREIEELGENATTFAIQLSSENAEILNNVDIIVAYGNDDLLKAMQKDKLLKTIPAIKQGAVAFYEDGSALAASATPTALSIPATIDEYLKVLKEAADRVR